MSKQAQEDLLERAKAARNDLQESAKAIENAYGVPTQVLVGLFEKVRLSDHYSNAVTFQKLQEAVQTI